MKDKEENRRNAVAFQDFLTQYFAVRTSKKIQELVGGAILFTRQFKDLVHTLDKGFCLVFGDAALIFYEHLGAEVVDLY